jgi:hypothetical protein
MTRFFLRLAPIPLCLFTAAVLFIHATLYAEPGLLNPVRSQPDCSMPCFLGIKPGQTRVETALSLLEASGWVERVVYSEFSGAQNIQWRWSPAAPPIFQSPNPGDGGSLGVEGGIIQFIELKSGLTWGDAYLWWGSPEARGFLFTTGGPAGGPLPPKPFLFLYRDINILVPVRCPYLRRAWRSPVTLVMGDTSAWLNKFVPPRFVSQAVPISQFILANARTSCRPML